jgi:hypothetical protein
MKCGIDGETLKDSSDTAVCRRIVEIGKGGRGQIATQLRVVRLQSAVISPRNNYAGKRVERARPYRARPLIEVAGILVKKRWQDSGV